MKGYDDGIKTSNMEIIRFTDFKNYLIISALIFLEIWVYYLI